MKASPLSARILVETDSGNREVPYWRTLYEAAVLELDANKQLERIAEAEHAIKDRMDDMNRSNDGSEREMLENALTVLGQLRKIADRMAKRAHGST